jgi:hypothetical protein
MDVKSIKLNPKNPRKKANKAKLKTLADSIKRDPKFMRIRPIVVDSNGVIMGGNKRYQAITEVLKMKDIPDDWVVMADDLTKEELERFILVDNSPKGMSGEWDFEMINFEFSHLDLASIGLDLKDIEYYDPIIDDDKFISDETEPEDEYEEKKESNIITIVLNAKEFEKWEEWKQLNDTKSDKKAFLKAIGVN